MKAINNKQSELLTKYLGKDMMLRIKIYESKSG